MRHCPVADILAIVVGTQAIGLILPARSLISPQAVLALLHGGHQIPVGQIRERMPAIEAVDILEKNQVLTMCAVESFQIALPNDSRMVQLWSALARLAPERPHPAH